MALHLQEHRYIPASEKSSLSFRAESPTDVTVSLSSDEESDFFSSPNEKRKNSQMSFRQEFKIWRQERKEMLQLRKICVEQRHEISSLHKEVKAEQQNILKKELQALKTIYRSQVTSFEDQVTTLREELKEKDCEIKTIKEVIISKESEETPAQVKKVEDCAFLHERKSSQLESMEFELLSHQELSFSVYEELACTKKELENSKKQICKLEHLLHDLSAFTLVDKIQKLSTILGQAQQENVQLKEELSKEQHTASSETPSPQKGHTGINARNYASSRRGKISTKR
jgi:hypothetical protein